MGTSVSPCQQVLDSTLRARGGLAVWAEVEVDNQSCSSYFIKRLTLTPSAVNRGQPAPAPPCHGGAVLRAEQPAVRAQQRAVVHERDGILREVVEC